MRPEIFWRAFNIVLATVYILGCDASGILNGSILDRNIASISEPPVFLPPSGDSGELYANYTTENLTLDGNLSEPAWTTTRSLIFANFNRSDNITDVKILWNDQFLFLGYKVSDLKHEVEGGPIYLDDGVEFYLDTLYNRTTTFDADDALAIVTFTGRAFADGLLTTTHFNYGITSLPNSEISIEIAIPWSSLKIIPAPDKKLGLLLVNNDRDNTVSKTYDWMGVIDQTGIYKSPNLYGTLILWK